MKKLLNLLETTRERYEALVIDRYLLWCDLNGYDLKDVQKLLANAALFNWWYRQYQLLEAEFMEEAENYTGRADLISIRKYHENKMITIRRVYSKPLMNAARNLKPLTHQLN